ncbi:dihydrolipoamide acetyltransferase family protein [Arthrobacter woluwensis]|uniref:Dihydrolipoamide acetyltransferase component of pyruvate dehydrogenase complex n=1 Tax=Arthrobacter woluwensis TaxID=156980 RepID=A0A1H4R6H3_9MICC|nr:dihydrolipoamide acetyltransferase family protein [Arthrobacter woluwensis]SEC27492.1 pyruvate dehydrogenase E2 component (dihydrolipoamide acetyltransferase) [Arthrobacter woluwensis]
MSREFLLPDLGEGLTEAELVRWLVAVGDSVTIDQPVAEVETAKAVVEVPSPFAGTVAVLHGAEGETLDVGKPLISIDEGGASAAPVLETASDYRTEERAGSGNVLIGYGTSGSTDGGRSRRRKTAAPAGLASAGETPRISPAPAQRDSVDGAEAVRVVSPLVRKLARDLGVALHALDGSGPDGLILRRDVEQASAGSPAASAAATAGANAVGPATATAGYAAGQDAPKGAGADEPTDHSTDPSTGLPIAARTPLRGMRRTIAQAMVRSRTEIPEATVWVDVDATDLVELRAGLKRRDPENAPSLLAFIARFVLAGLAKYPKLNTRIETAEDGGQEIVSFDGVNLGFAAQTDRGLVVPSIRAAHRLSARGLDGELKRLTGVARDGKASPADLSGSTFTLNNYGVFGVDGSAAIINHPEAAILGVGRIIDRPWVVDGALAVRKVAELSLVFDHRVCDGGTAGGFLRYVADAIESPGTVLADL